LAAADFSMLQHLNQTDLDAVLAACGPAEAGGSDDGRMQRERLFQLVDALPREAQEELLALM
jgi:hypothetical protein